MKVYRTIMLLAVFFISETKIAVPGSMTKDAAITSPRSVLPYQDLWYTDRFHSFCLSGGTSVGFKHSDPGLKGTFAYFISQTVSAGLEAGLYFGDTTFKTDRALSAGLRASYHLVKPARNRHANPWDVYGGLSAGVDFGRGAKSVDEVDPYADVHVGASYLFTDNWMLFGELAGRNASLGLALRF